MTFLKMGVKWLLVSLFACLAYSAQAEGDWSKSDASSTVIVDHAIWNGILERHVITDATGLNLFDYASAAITNREALTTYIKQLEGTFITTLNKLEQKALWINLYNALTVKLIIDNLPVNSIKKIKSGLLSFGPWDQKLITVEGKELSLNDIEHKILRPLFKDNRIHYAVNCASTGCPNLQNKSYTAENLNHLLDSAAKQYINHPRGVTIEDDELVLSSIYKWYSEDFGEDEKDLIEHLLKYAEPNLKAQLELFDEVDGYQYDWGLNQS